MKWSDGSALTPADVAFSFGLLKKYPDVNTTGHPIASVLGERRDGHVLLAAVHEPAEHRGNVYIVPQAIWSTVGDPATYTDASPVGTGPYTFGSSARRESR